MKESVVVPAVSVPSSHVCLRSLYASGVNTIVISERDSPEVFCSRYSNESLRVPNPNKDLRAYKNTLLQLAERPDVQTVVPVREEDIYVLSKYRDHFADHIGTPWPKFEKLRRVQDRTRLYEAADAAGVAMPETCLLTHCDDWSRRWVIKGRYSILGDVYVDDVYTELGEKTTEIRHSTGNRLVDPPSTRYLKQDEEPNIDALCSEMGHVPIVQEHVPDTQEYSFCAIYDSGDALATFQHRQIRGYNYSGGTSAFRESVAIPELEEAGLKLLDYLDWHGPADVEFKRDPDTGEFKLMEVNPRFWSSVPFAVAAGVDFPLYYWLVATDRDVQVEPGYDVGLASHLLMGELFYLYSVIFGEENELVDRPPVISETMSVIKSLLLHPKFDYLDVTDPCPPLRYAYNELRRQLQ